MKIPEKLAGMILMLIIAGSLSLSAQSGNRRSERTDRMWSEKIQRPLMLEDSDSLKMRAKRFGLAPGKMMCPYQHPKSGKQFMGRGGKRPERSERICQSKDYGPSDGGTAGGSKKLKSLNYLDSGY